MSSLISQSGLVSRLLRGRVKAAIGVSLAAALSLVSTSALANLVFKGQWRGNTVYAVNDVVFFGGHS